MQVLIENLNDGMILCADVLGPAGNVLLPAGTALMNSHIRGLQMWGVRGVDIQGDDAQDQPQQKVYRPASFQRLNLARLEWMFTHADKSHPVINQLYRECQRRIAETHTHEH